MGYSVCIKTIPGKTFSTRCNHTLILTPLPRDSIGGHVACEMADNSFDQILCLKHLSDCKLSLEASQQKLIHTFGARHVASVCLLGKASPLFEIRQKIARIQFYCNVLNFNQFKA